MTADQYVAWFVGMAVLVTAILALGILEAAGLLPHPWRRDNANRAAQERPDADVIEHHHWYDRFHHHAA